MVGHRANMKIKSIRMLAVCYSISCSSSAITGIICNGNIQGVDVYPNFELFGASKLL